MKTTKRLLALVLALVMLISIAPLAVAEAHPSYGSVQIRDKENNTHTMNYKEHYYINDAESCTDDPEGANVSYNEETGIMVLNNFDGGEIRFNGVGDVAIIAKGTNNIKGYQFGIYAPDSNLTITSTDNATVNLTTQNDNAGGIVTTWAHVNNNNITISGKLNINIDTSTHNSFAGIRAGGTLSILDNASVSVKGISDDSISQVYGLRGNSLELNTTGAVSVETGSVKNRSFALYFNEVSLKNAEQLTLKSVGDSKQCLSYPESNIDLLIATENYEDKLLTNTEYDYNLLIRKHHSYNAVVIPPKANAVGYTTHTCACGDSYKDTFKAPTGKPAGVKCAAKTAAAEKITWNKVPTAKGYQVQVSNAAGNKWATYKTLSANSYVFQKLAAGSNYKFRVRFYITAEDGNNYFSQWTVIASPTLPKATKITSIKSPKSKTVGIYWSKVAGISGYQIQISSSSNFKKDLKTVVSKSSSKSAVFKTKRNAGKRCYIRIRTFKKIGGKNYYSTWSAAKSIVIKK